MRGGAVRVRVLAAMAVAAGGAVAVGVAGCRERTTGWRQGVDTASLAVAALDTAARVRRIEGFHEPESARWDAARGVWYVSNMNGDPTAKDGNGFISRLHADGTVDSLHFIQGGRGGAALDAPKGLALTGDTLWVADIDQVRAFDAPTGRPLATIDLRPRHAAFLNDVAVGGDGALYVTDMAVRFTRGGKTEHPVPDRIFRIAGGQATVALKDDSLGRPNGIAWDSAGGRFVVVPWAGRILRAWTPGHARADSLASGPGQFDGVEVLPDGRILVTSWVDSTVYALQSGDLRPLVRGVPGPADIGVDPPDRLLMIPQVDENRVELWRLPPR